jgi:hypothetical protein
MIELYRHTEDTEKRKARAQEMYTKFCTSESPQALNIEGSLRNTINKGIESVSIAAFREAQKMTWKVLKNEWFPEFCASELFQECNGSDSSCFRFFFFQSHSTNQPND